MKTKWGSCNRQTGSIRLNTELAKKPPECLEYILVHELIHFLERNHGERFVALMNQHIPGWRVYRNRLNRLPLRHEQWSY
ncbi:MAG TPA: M48 family metallopeptidase, partial [Leptospiraceae bacterium]|nr:M48 family metallopeptidase [Leptospiraceae bacterium]